MNHRKRPPLALLVLPLVIGMGGLSRVMQSPSFQLYRTVDVVQLLGSGACFGVSMAGIIFMLRGKRA